MNKLIDKVVILAAGLGTRMRRTDPDVELRERQAAMADLGVKALIPIDRPFLDYLLTNVADAGLEQVCLVIGPDHHELRRYYAELECHRLRFTFAIQAKALGTADALLAAESFAGGDPFLMLNSDNFYPTSALRELRELEDNGLVGYERQALVERGNIPADRVAAFAAITMDTSGYLEQIVEKPADSELGPRGDRDLLSMNCWRFGPAIFTACRHINPSPRGEFEIPDAVMYSIEHQGQRYHVVRSGEPVLDLSCRRDVESVGDHLKGMEVRL